jgi:hypothetical protein
MLAISADPSGALHPSVRWSSAMRALSERFAIPGSSAISYIEPPKANTRKTCAVLSQVLSIKGSWDTHAVAFLRADGGGPQWENEEGVTWNERCVEW